MPANETVLEFEYDDDATATLVAESVRPEVGEIASDRSTTSLRCDGGTVVVTVAADDRVALRAGVNTWIRLVAVAERTRGLVSGS
ncbi:KEOPS complex subunit Pcc1 [Haloarchaeobius iranensis]|uniref:KEOPS complex subunit Pcc1 n=1 Tax=Haloarchaeobius iranensis TaxID=996166 RepID=A0A1G9T198_9EURY|nr:KEOPS complex subunit Pcc1 [Haloarchaeobius iranensis]SDM40855.1 KEOPS complex subunit Pcc1 [Haloarchaeobius iranensis]